MNRYLISVGVEAKLVIGPVGIINLVVSSEDELLIIAGGVACLKINAAIGLSILIHALVLETESGQRVVDLHRRGIVLQRLIHRIDGGVSHNHGIALVVDSHEIHLVLILEEERSLAPFVTVEFQGTGGRTREGVGS